MAKPSANRVAKQLFGVPWGRMESREDRQRTALVLSYSRNDMYRRLAEEAMSPLYQHTSFAKLVEKFGISFQQLAREYTEIQRSEGYLRVANHLPELMEQAALDAKSRSVPCTRCEGTGKVMRKDKPIKCATCLGTGERYELGDLDRLKLVFEMTQLTGQRNQNPPVNVNLDLRDTARHQPLEDLSASVAAIIDAPVEES